MKWLSAYHIQNRINSIDFNVITCHYHFQFETPFRNWNSSTRTFQTEIQSFCIFHHTFYRFSQIFDFFRVKKSLMNVELSWTILSSEYEYYIVKKLFYFEFCWKRLNMLTKLISLLLIFVTKYYIQSDFPL